MVIVMIIQSYQLDETTIEIHDDFIPDEKEKEKQKQKIYEMKSIAKAIIKNSESKKAGL